MNYALGVPKGMRAVLEERGMRAVLEERGMNTHHMIADKMREVLSSHPDFKNEKSTIERFLVEERGLCCPNSTVNSTPSRGYGHKQSDIHVHEHIVSTASRVFRTQSCQRLTLSRWKLFTNISKRLGIYMFAY